MPFDVTQGIDFRDGQVHWNELVLDPDQPFDDQIVAEDAFYVTFPNGTDVDVFWFGRAKEFCVNLQQQDRNDFKDLGEWRCQSLPELRQRLAHAVSIALAQPSTQRPILHEHEFRPGLIETNHLCLDPLRPLADQLADLPDDLLEVMFGFLALALTASRSPVPPYAAHVILHQTPAWDFDDAGNYRRRIHLWTPLLQRTCHFVDELRKTLSDFIKTACESEIHGPDAQT